MAPTRQRVDRRGSPVDVPEIDPKVATGWEADIVCAEVAVNHLLERVRETRAADYWQEHYLWSVYRKRLLELRRKIHAVTL